MRQFRQNGEQHRIHALLLGSSFYLLGNFSNYWEVRTLEPLDSFTVKKKVTNCRTRTFICKFPLLPYYVQKRTYKEHCIVLYKTSKYKNWKLFSKAEQDMKNLLMSH